MILNLSVKQFFNALALMLLSAFVCCSNKHGEKQNADTTIKSVQNQIVEKLNQDTTKKTKDLQKDDSNDLKEFRSLLRNFKEALRSNKIDDLKDIMNFPFYTSNEDDADGKGVATDPIQADEFMNYKSAIYTTDVIHLLPLAKEDDLSEIDNSTEETYYKTLKENTDKGSIVYEVYMQYPEAGTNSESYFGFVFGKIKGEYKAIASYAKWPVK